MSISSPIDRCSLRSPRAHTARPAHPLLCLALQPAKSRKSYLEKFINSNSDPFSSSKQGGFTYLSRESHLQTDQPVALVDSRGGIWHALLIHDASGLSGGWRGFTIDHRLEVGDALVFEMAFPYVFLVRIFKASQGGEEENCAGAAGTRERRIRAAGRVKTGEKRKLNEAQVRGDLFEALQFAIFLKRSVILS